MWALLQPKDKRERLLLGNTLGKHKASKDAPQGLSSISKSLKTLKFQSPSKQWLVEWLIGEALITLLDADDTN